MHATADECHTDQSNPAAQCHINPSRCQQPSSKPPMTATSHPPSHVQHAPPRLQTILALLASTLALLSLPCAHAQAVTIKGDLHLCQSSATQPNLDLSNCTLNQEVALANINSYTVQVPPNSNFSLLVQVKASSGDVDLQLIGPLGSGLQLTSDQRLGEQVLWLTAANISSITAGQATPLNFTVNVIGYAYWSSYQLTVQTQMSVALVRQELAALQCLHDTYCNFYESPMPLMCSVMQKAVALDHAIADDICNQPPSMCSADGHLIKFVMLSSDIGNVQVGTLPECLTQFEHLETLDLSMNYIFVPMAELANRTLHMPQLHQLLVIQGRVSGTLDCAIFTHPNMTELYLNNGNLLVGTLPSCMFNSSTLTQLALSGNMLQGTIPEFPKKSPLMLLDLSGSSSSSGSQSGYLVGPVPSSIIHASGLVSLDVSNNQLTGLIPDMTTTLVTFSASNNRLRGSLPSSMGSTVYRTLRLGHNRLTGTVPGGLIYAAPLETLNLTSNLLTGSINFIWGNKQLKHFDVSDNLLTGELPYLLGQLPQLSILNLGGNHMMGDLSKFSFSNSSITFFNVSGNALVNGLPSSLKELRVFSYLPPSSCLTPSTDPAAPPAGSAFDVGNTGLDVVFPLWLLDALGGLYNLSGGDSSCIQIKLYTGNNVIRCPSPDPNRPLLPYYYQVQAAYGLKCLDSLGVLIPLTAALGYDALLSGNSTSPSPSPSGKSSNAGVIAAAVLGAVIGVAALAGLGYWLYKSGRLSRSLSNSRKVPLTFNTTYDPSDASHHDLFSSYPNPLAAPGSLVQRRA